MSKIKFYSYLLNEEGQAIPGADITICLAETDDPAMIYLGETSNTPNTDDPQLITNQDGYFEFWLGDSSDPNGYSAFQKFKIKWSKSGVTSGYNDYISILSWIAAVDVTDDDEFRDKGVSNLLAKGWQDHKEALFNEVHGLEPVDKTDDDEIKNKLVSNLDAQTWEDTKWIKWEYITSENNYIAGYSGYIIDASENDVNIWLPENPVVGMPVGFATINVNNTIVINRNGKLIFGNENNLYLDLDTSGLTMVYTGEDYGWTIVSEISGISPLDGDTIEISYLPDNYVRDGSIPEAESEISLSAHLKGMDDKIGEYLSSKEEFSINTVDWTVESGLYMYQIDHNMNDHFPNVTTWNTDTKMIEKMADIYSVNENSIKLYVDSQVALRVKISI